MCRHYREKLLLVTREVDALRRDQASDWGLDELLGFLSVTGVNLPNICNLRRCKVSLWFLMFALGGNI